MRKITATAGSEVFLVVAPGAVAGLVPWWSTGWRTGAAYPAPLHRSAFRAYAWRGAIPGAALTARHFLLEAE